tara:strand:- start:483 stop:665 length:183 start_codon:yes stop_codon:yes gene_type:complete
MAKKKLTRSQVGRIQGRMSKDTKMLLDDKLMYGAQSNVATSAQKLIDLFTGLLNKIVKRI